MIKLLKIVPKRLYIYSTIVGLLYSLSDYGESISLSHYGTSPLTLEKILHLTICIFILDLIKLITSNIAYYIDSINEVKTRKCNIKILF